VSAGITLDPKKLKAIWKWPTPRKKHGIRSFMGLCTYYRWFVSGFTDIAKPLTRLVKEKQAFQWTREVEASFQSLKEALCTTPILSYVQPGERFIVTTDANNFGIGVLSVTSKGWTGVSNGVVQ
jgi:hypothetical protein